MTLLFTIAILGMAATAVMDIWARLQQRLFGIRPLDYRLLGRWLLHMRHGRFYHKAIWEAEKQRGERLLGWGAHYAIGVLFAALFVFIVGRAWPNSPTLAAPLIFGISTVIVPFLLMQPAFGLGIAARKAPDPLHARRNSLLAHTSFGIGLYAGGWITACLPLAQRL